MKFTYRLNRICGNVYSNGTVAFTQDGNSIISPIGNRLNAYDLLNQKSNVLPLENRKNIKLVVISHNGKFLISVDVDGNALFFNYVRKVLIHKFNFRHQVYDIQFSPNDKYFAVTYGHGCQIWKTPNIIKEFSPLQLYKTIIGTYDDTICLSWSANGRSIIVGSKDLTARIYYNVLSKYMALSILTGHRDEVLGVYFSDESQAAGEEVAYTIARDGGVFTWRFQKATPVVEGGESMEKTSKEGDEEEEEEKEDNDDNDEQEDGLDDLNLDNNNEQQKNLKIATQPVVRSKGVWQLQERQLIRDAQSVEVVCTAYNTPSHLLVLGFANGVFGLYDMPGLTNLQKLSVANTAITSISLNSTGEWLALGIRDLGQLLVWEWKSETYILKQQGHIYGLNTLDFSQEGQYIATGGEDGTVKLWNTLSGFCVITFKEHIAPVTGVKFIGQGQGKAILSSSLDGTVRAHDLLRYKNFKTLTAPSSMVQFTCLAADGSGEVVCAGSLDPFNIYVWSLQTGKLLEILSGHEGPIACLAFNPQRSLLASGSWDGTLKLWDVYKNTCVETFEHGCDILAVTFRADGKEVACSATNGNIYLWDVEEGQQVGMIEGRRDISGGRLTTDRTTAENSARSKFFTALDYSSDGSCILAGGRSKYICIYAVGSGVLVKKFQLSHNRSLEGVHDKLRSDHLLEGQIVLDNLPNNSNEEHVNAYARMHSKGLPGGGKSTLTDGARTTRPELMTLAIQFSPTGREWAAASTQGLQIFGLEEHLLFAPIDLDVSITPQTIALALMHQDYGKAITMAIQLHDHRILTQSIEAIPMHHIELVMKSLSPLLLKELMKYLAVELANSPKLEFYLRWTLAILQVHGNYIHSTQNNMSLTESLRSLLRVLLVHEKEILKMTMDNVSMLNFILSQMTVIGKEGIEEAEEEDLIERLQREQAEEQAKMMEEEEAEEEEEDAADDSDDIQMIDEGADDDENEEDWKKMLPSAWEDDEDEAEDEDENEEITQQSTKLVKGKVNKQSKIAVEAAAAESQPSSTNGKSVKRKKT